jgi:23S rRNA (cytosine1962-C5)-methyltransferase
MADGAPTLELPEHLERSLGRGHPWVYRDHVPRGASFADGSIVRVVTGAFSGWGIWDAKSAIAVRMLSAERRPDAAWVADKVRSAWQLRQELIPKRCSAFRWIFGEGDGLPGLTVDFYAGYAVIVSYAGALDALVPWLVDALAATTELAGIVRRREGGLELLRGREPPRELVIEEHGIVLHADLGAGQKTGLFLDHRENRRFCATLAPGREVLNLFSYTGAFSLYAALAGARSVVSVDSAAPALDAARENFRLNGLDPDAHEFVERDAFAFLERAGSQARRFDLVICDPPSFAHSRQQAAAALKAYARLNAMGLRVTRARGYYAAASCTSQVGHDAFVEVLSEAARRAKRRLQIVHDAGQAADHPVMAAHPEGRYLKFVVARVLEAR